MKSLFRSCVVGVLLLSGCESATKNENAGIEGTGDRVTLASAYGTVSGFGSIYVNGVHFDTDTAEVEISGESATEAALAVGMVVQVIGEVGPDGKTGIAQSIQAERVLLGIVESVADVGRGRKALRVLGQTVYINEDATFVGTSFEDIAAGIGLSVSGFVTDNGLITGTYVAQQVIDVTADVLQVEGYISSVDEAAQMLVLNELSVHISTADFIRGTAADLAAGKRVRVVGTLPAGAQTLQAIRVEFVSRPAGESRYTSLEGVVRDLIPGTSFTLHGTPVTLQNAEIEHGVTENILAGMQVVAFGPVNQGVLQAERIHIKPLNTSRFRGVINDIDVESRSFELLDATFQVTKFTQFKDDSPSMERYFNFDSLRTGEEIEVFAVSVDGVWHVTRIMRRGGPMGGPPDLLRGQPTQVEDGQGFYIGTIYVDGSELPEHEWTALRDHQDLETEVDVEGFYTGGGQFRAIHVHVRPSPPCDPRVFFECGEGKPRDMPPPPPGADR